MPAVILDQVHWAQLEQVQMQLNRQVAYVTDMERFGVPDWWEPAVDRGDCEDIALAKRQRLIQMGWPAELLRIAVVADGRGDLHALLTVDVTAPSGKPATYALDSHFTHVEPWARLNAYGYQWLERSKPGLNQWTRLDKGAPADAQRIARLAATIMPASPVWNGGRGPGENGGLTVQVKMIADRPAVEQADAVQPLASAHAALADEQPILRFSAEATTAEDVAG